MHRLATTTRYSSSACRSHVVPARRVVRVCATSAAELQEEFGIEEHVSFEEGSEGLTKAVLKHSCGSSAEVYLFGACCTSWTQATGDEILYCRPDAVFDGSKPISGGIPHCFPQFGPGEMQQHGFARNVEWAVGSTSADLQPDERDPSIELVLTPSDYSDAMFPYKFKVVYTLTLHGEELQTIYRVLNEDDKPFQFTAALHSYFEVLDIDLAKVTGLKGLTYLDKSEDPSNPSEVKEDRDAVTFGTKLVDSVYVNANDQVALEVGTGAAISLASTGWSDCVLWNPHLTMESCYKQFVCVENAQFSEPVTLEPGADWLASVNMNVIDV